ncbi:MAG: 16S rRNA processing protein RimM [Melioribacteraceae bacterium]|nr:16S rRNA processing protein RimM [Melioribacteraceae bacterium]
MKNYFLIAKIISVFNDDGYLKLRSYSDFPDRFFLLEKIFIDIYNEKRLFLVEDVERIEDYFILKLENFDSSQHVDFLVGSNVYVDAKNLYPLDDETYYFHDLIGCKVFFNDKFFGKIEDVMHLSSNDVYLVRSEDDEKLIPAISDLIESININEKVVYLKQDFDKFSDDEN